MRATSQGKILRLHFCESDRFEGVLLYKAIVQKCRDLRVAGATVLQGLEGYGETGGIHRPVAVIVVDSAEKIAELTAAAEAMIGTGMIAVSDADVVRVQREKAG